MARFAVMCVKGYHGRWISKRPLHLPLMGFDHELGACGCRRRLLMIDEDDVDDVVGFDGWRRIDGRMDAVEKKVGDAFAAVGGWIGSIGISHKNRAMMMRLSRFEMGVNQRRGR
ncbi:hypothetical protein ACLOJK_015243 [Asimina triloba]